MRGNRTLPGSRDSWRKPLGVLGIFFKLGFTSFGGPSAHLGYFRAELVLRRRWLSDADYAGLVALCQFLPGPASSQVGFALGLQRAGWRGAAAAWLGFTLPSATVLVGCALAGRLLGGGPAHGILHGLQLVAAPIVAQAVLGMARSFCTDLTRRLLAAAALGLALSLPAWAGQVLAISLAAIAGAWFLGEERVAVAPAPSIPVGRTTAAIALASFLTLLLAAVLIRTHGQGGWPAQLASFYQSGSLVFGGGHVVLPLLRAAFVDPGWIDEQTFLTGYGLAQAIPGPLFTFAAWLGASANLSTAPIRCAIGATLAIFLPGFLLLVAALPFWQALRHNRRAGGAVAGSNAAVVGILAAALYKPIATGSVHSLADAALCLLGLLSLLRWQIAPWLLVLLFAAAGFVVEGSHPLQLAATGH